MKGTAVFSPDRHYRYVLGRGWGDGVKLTWVMVNPSTASAMKNDPTIRRVIQFSRDWGYDGAYVVNLFAIRSPDPKSILLWDDPVGPDNDKWLLWAASKSPGIVLAWGNAGGRFPARVKEVLKLLERRKSDFRTVGPLTGRGHPPHPLMLPTNTKQERFVANL